MKENEVEIRAAWRALAAAVIRKAQQDEDMYFFSTEWYQTLLELSTLKEKGTRGEYHSELSSNYYREAPYER